MCKLLGQITCRVFIHRVLLCCCDGWMPNGLGFHFMAQTDHVSMAFSIQ